ncbi:hypothetical protein [Nocardia neocaledoniensis]|uniref:hypothetical protein n=1 Tax=Nocardia neocaledoniensis TaxID=236511 RepID=UPI000D70C5B1|nr:hypothetical protein [Nocardia neocaledoniensis]
MQRDPFDGESCGDEQFLGQVLADLVEQLAVGGPFGSEASTRMSTAATSTASGARWLVRSGSARP